MTDTRADGLEVFRELMPGIMPDDVKSLRDGQRALLVVLGPVVKRTDARRYDQQARPELAADGAGFHAGRDHPGAAGGERAPRPGQHQLRDIAGEAQIV